MPPIVRRSPAAATNAAAPPAASFDALDHVAIVATEGRAILDLATGADLGARVPGLRWSVRDVIAHLGAVHRWAERIVRNRSMRGESYTKSRLDGDDLLGWYAESVSSLTATLAATDPAAPCPNFSSGCAAVAAFWPRRQAHETTVHRCDVERALGRPSTIEAAVACDGVDEMLEVFVSRRPRPQDLLAPLGLVAIDPAIAWTARPAGSRRVDVEPGLAPDVAATVAGPPADLLLRMWNRPILDGDRLVVNGDATVVESFGI